MTADLLEHARNAVECLKRAGLTVATAESCTGGLVAAALTEIPGASAVFRYGWVTYCNDAKEQQLHVPRELIERHSVVSEPVVAAMAQNAMQTAGADMAVAVSGNAGPTAGDAEPPVGTVCLALACRGAQLTPHTETLYHPELGRAQLRELAARRLLELVAEAASPTSAQPHA